MSNPTITISDCVPAITVTEEITKVVVTEESKSVIVSTLGTQGAQGSQGDTGPAGTTDHSLLTNLSVDSHAQYLTESRHDSLPSDNPHGVTQTQVGLSNVVNADTTTTSNISDSSNKRFMTDAQESNLDNQSGTNTGDQDLSSYVVGPASVTTYKTAFFDGTTGKLIKQGVDNYSDALGIYCASLFYSRDLGTSSAVAYGLKSGRTGMFARAAHTVGFSCNGTQMAEVNTIGMSIGAGNTTIVGLLNIEKPDKDVPLTVFNTKATISRDGNIRSVYHSQETTLSITTDDTSLAVSMRSKGSFSVAYKVVVRNTSLSGTNVYEGVASGYTSSKGQHVIEFKTETVSHEALGNLNFTIVPNAKTTAIVGRMESTLKYSYVWDIYFDIQENYE